MRELQNLGRESQGSHLRGLVPSTLSPAETTAAGAPKLLSPAWCSPKSTGPIARNCELGALWIPQGQGHPHPTPDFCLLFAPIEVPEPRSSPSPLSASPLPIDHNVPGFLPQPVSGTCLILSRQPARSWLPRHGSKISLLPFLLLRSLWGLPPVLWLLYQLQTPGSCSLSHHPGIPTAVPPSLPKPEFSHPCCYLPP